MSKPIPPIPPESTVNLDPDPLSKNENPLLIKTDDFMAAVDKSLEIVRSIKPKVKMFENPIGGEVIMPDGEILPITVFFPPEVRPARVGVYVTNQDDNLIDSEAQDGMITIGFSHWDGENWGPQFQSIESASANHGAAKWAPKPWAALITEHPDNQI